LEDQSLVPNFEVLKAFLLLAFHNLMPNYGMLKTEPFGHSSNSNVLELELWLKAPNNALDFHG
jgi:hypothetical protein